MSNVIRSNKKNTDDFLWFKTTQNLIQTSTHSISDSLFGQIFIFPIQEKHVLKHLSEYTKKIETESGGVLPPYRHEKDILQYIAQQFQDEDNFKKYIKSRKFDRETIIGNLSSEEILKSVESYFDIVINQYSNQYNDISRMFCERLKNKYEKALPSDTTSAGKYILLFMLLEAINIDTILDSTKIPLAVSDYIGDIFHPYIRVRIDDVSLSKLYELAFSNPNISLDVFFHLITDVDNICNNHNIPPNSWIPEFTGIVSDNIDILLRKFDLCEFNKLFDFFERIKSSELKRELLNSCGDNILRQALNICDLKKLDFTDEIVSFMNKANKFKKNWHSE